MSTFVVLLLPVLGGRVNATIGAQKMRQDSVEEDQNGLMEKLGFLVVDVVLFWIILLSKTSKLGLF